jgi:integrase
MNAAFVSRSTRSDLFVPRSVFRASLSLRGSRFLSYLKEAKVAKRRLYDCRSTFCSRTYAAGIQPILIELLMGHAGSGLVHTYAKADDDFNETQLQSSKCSSLQRFPLKTLQRLRLLG